MQKKEHIIIFSAKRARELLKKGYSIVDIKPDKEDPDGKRTVYVFKYEEGMLKA